MRMRLKQLFSLHQNYVTSFQLKLCIKSCYDLKSDSMTINDNKSFQIEDFITLIYFEYLFEKNNSSTFAFIIFCSPTWYHYHCTLFVMVEYVLMLRFWKGGREGVGHVSIRLFILVIEMLWRPPVAMLLWAKMCVSIQLNKLVIFYPKNGMVLYIVRCLFEISNGFLSINWTQTRCV